MKILFKSKKMSYVATMGLILALAVYMTHGFQIQIQMIDYVLAQNQTEEAKGGESAAQLETANVTGELTKPAEGNPYGGEKIGDITINSDGHLTNINGLISASPAEGNVFEAWLADEGGSGYKISLGQIMDNGTIDVGQHMVNPFTYSVFIITEEPQDDVDPNAADAIAGIELEAPFGQ
jgi:hypothetical protein